MTNFLYTETMGGLWKEGIVDSSKEELIKRIENAEVFHLPLGDCIKIDGTFIHAILISGCLWDATDRKWEIGFPLYYAVVKSEESKND